MLNNATKKESCKNKGDRETYPEAERDDAKLCRSLSIQYTYYAELATTSDTRNTFRYVPELSVSCTIEFCGAAACGEQGCAAHSEAMYRLLLWVHI